MRLPRHIGIIPDGNRRWALDRGMEKPDGYKHGISPGMTLYHMCRQLGIEEMSFYGFTVDNTKRPSAQRQAFTKACVAAVEELSKEDASLLVLGNTQSPMFPPELLPYTRRHDFGAGGMKINFLVNYSWEWDMGFKTEKSGTDSAASGMIGPVPVSYPHLQLMALIRRLTVSGLYVSINHSLYCLRFFRVTVL